MAVEIFPDTYYFRNRASFFGSQVGSVGRMLSEEVQLLVYLNDISFACLLYPKEPVAAVTHLLICGRNILQAIFTAEKYHACVVDCVLAKQFFP